MSGLAPCLRSDLSIIAQVYGGKESYVVKDLTAQKYYRFGATEVRVMRSFDGRRTPTEIAAALASEGLRLSVQTIEAFARKMASAGFLERTIAEKTTLQIERLRAERRQRQRPRLFRGELLRMRWSFGDPDAMLARALPTFRWMFTPAFIAVSVVLFAIYLVLLGQQWGAFSSALRATYSLHSITLGAGFTLWITAAVIILIHELGHGMTCKYFGGEVRELGFMLLYFQPAFYCDVSDAWSFPERRARLWVTAAGSWIQLVVASLAAIMWTASAPGSLAADVGVAAMLVGGVTTLFTNANPLLPLDGYFALVDWLEIPNLRHRALAHLNWWVKRHVFRLELPEPSVTARERRVFLIYGALSVAYAVAIFALLGALVLGWASRAFGTLGAVLVLTALLLMLRQRIVKLARTSSLALRTWRASRTGRPRRTLAASALVVLLLGLVFPWTLTSPGRFVAHPAATQTVTAPDSGVVSEVFVAEGTQVDAGAPLLRIVDRSLEHALLAAGRAVDSLTTEELIARAAARAGDAERVAAERASSMAQLAALERRVGNLTLRAATSGMVASARPEDLVGRVVAGGDSLLIVAAMDSVELRVSLERGGATAVRRGQIIHAISYGNESAPWTGVVGDVSALGIATNAPGGGVEVRVRRLAGTGWRPGTIGEASIELRRSTVFGALLWKGRQLLRTDLWL